MHWRLPKRAMTTISVVCVALLVNGCEAQVSGAPPDAGNTPQATVAAPQEGSQFDPLPAGDPLPLTLTEYAARAVWDDGISLEGRTVQLTGFVSAAPDGRWYLTRLGL